MAASPDSTSSSDLYAASGPTEEQSPFQPVDDEDLPGQVATPGSGILPSSVQLPHGVRFPPEETGHHTGHARSEGGFTRSLANAYFKRKREEDPETLYVTRAESESPGPIAQAHHSPRDGATRPKSKPRLSQEECSGPKRIRTTDHSSAKVGSIDVNARPATLPAELWHHIFRFVPPVFLGRLLSVNHAFHSYLTSSVAEKEPLVRSFRGRVGVQPLDAETIWAASRKRFAPGLPKPLRGLQELDMWRLLRGRICQLCGQTKSSGLLSNTENPWESGPGEQGVRVIWSFGIRSCGPCLEKCSEKEVDLLLSSDCPSFLLPALPFAFVSSSLNYIPISLLRESTAPPSARIVKRFYKPHVLTIKQQLNDVRELGAASADEWSKGLADEGRERVNDAIRWEQWEAKGGLKKVNTRPQVKAITTLTTTSTVTGLPKRPNAPDWEGLNPQDFQQHPHSATPPYHVPWINTGPFQEPAAYYPPPSLPSARPERSIKDAMEAKAARRAEIERRCSLFDPPLPPNILNHMESFQAAIQISTPLTDTAWDVLKPRLLAQRASAEKREQEHVQQVELLQSESKQRRYQESQTRESKDVTDRHWDSVQAPIRDRLGALADAVIAARWSGGRAVTKESSPRFAADVLLSVRQHFYDGVAREQEASGARSPTLILENMKWLFDTKIKPLTEPFQKELFLCNGCDDNYKFYGFEGVIQHYAAKHTTSLSKGSIVVHWRAEWPEEPPFNPEPSLSKSVYYKVPSPATARPDLYNHTDQPLYDPGNRFGDLNESDPMQGSDGVPATQSAPSYYSTQTAPPQTNPYPQSYGQVYPAAPASAGMPNGMANGFAQTSPNGHLQQWQGSDASIGSAQVAVGQDVSPLYPGNHFPGTFSPNGTAPGAPYTTQIPPGAVAPRPLHFDPSRNNAAQFTEEYKQQMDEMAKQARDVWFSTSSIKDLPASVRIYVVVHHMAARFSEKFLTVPSLAMFLDGLDNNAQMRPVRSLNGLACKTCVMQYNASVAPNHQSHPPTGDRRLYTLPHLLNHFRVVHLEDSKAFANPGSGPDGPKRDWTRDMIELPEDRLIADLVHCSGMDDNKLELIAWAFPHAFPSPLPKLGTLRTLSQVQNTGEAFGFNNNYPPAISSHGLFAGSSSSKARGDDQSYNRSLNAFRSTSRLSGVSEPLGEDEYDPHKPAYQGSNGMDGRGDVMGFPIERAGDKYAWQESDQDRQLPESADLSKLLYNATQMQTSHKSGKPPERPNEQHYHLQAGLTSPQAFDPQPPADHESSSVHGSYDDRHSGKDNRYPDAQPIDHAVPEYRMVASSRFEARSPSVNAGLRAAERFLHHFGQGSEVGDYRRPKSFEQRGQPSPVNQWSGPGGIRIGEGTKQLYTEPSNSANYSTVRVGAMSPNGSKHDSRPASRNDPNTSPPHIQTSRMRDHPNYQQSASNTFIHINDTGSNGRRSRSYVDYAATRRMTVQASNDDANERPESSNEAFRVSQTYRHRDRPRSPVPVAMDTRYYQHGSPLEDLQAQPIYRVRSPLPQREPQMQRTFYERPGYDQYERVDNDEYDPNPPSRYRQRIEYVPVRIGNQSPPDSGRYIIAQPADPRGRAEYVRLDEAYDQGAVFERDGRLYRADPRPYQTQVIRGSTGSTLNY
ncbi:MAG: hypothetical protein Q9179_000600 [Wetmoreana sp. 5 TL-2023]